MNNCLKNSILFAILLIFTAGCKGQKTKDYENLSHEKISVLIPFMPGSCHQCNDAFYDQLKVLDAEKVDYSFVIPDNYSDDLDYIQKEYKLASYKKQQFIFSTALFDKYRVYEQSFVLQFGSDSSYKIYNNTHILIEDLKQLNNAEILNLGNYKIKKSTANITVKNKDQLYFKNSVQINAIDYVDLKDKGQTIKITFSEAQLFNNYFLHFKDSAIARSKLEEVKNVTDLADKNRFEQYEFVNDSLMAFSHHTYIASMKDSVLGGFSAINIYKDGTYLSSRAINKEQLPSGYTTIPRFHVYNNSMYIIVVKDHLETNNPNYFLAKFELENGAYQYKKMLNFTVPAINKDVGYSFLDLNFSGKYFMNSISNILYDLETEESVDLNIPVNKKFEFSDLISNGKGVNIVISNFNVQYPNLLITYFSKDIKGAATNVILNYNLQNKNIVGKIQMPMNSSMFLKPDLSKFGYFLWMPEEGNYDKLVYKKLF